MSEQLKAAFAGRPVTKFGQKDFELATVCLLMGMAAEDGNYDVYEFMTISKVISKAFAIKQDQADKLIGTAQELRATTAQLARLAHLISEHSSVNQRIKIVQMAWRVAGADQRIEHSETLYAEQVGGWLGLNRDQVLAARDLAREAAESQG